MNKVSRRAWIVLVVAVLIVAGSLAFVVQYFVKAADWVSFPGSPHVYTGINPSTGLVYDRSGTELLDATGERVYSDDVTLRMATMHLLGDRYGYIEAPLLGNYVDRMVGYNAITGLYATSDQTPTATLTISAAAQEAALSALNGQKGAVGVYNYKTGEILCAVTSPTYDPDNVPDIASDTTGAYDGVYVNRFFRSTYTPGSIFKIVTLAAALENVSGIESETFHCEGSCIIGGELITCTGIHGSQTLGQALTNSCNCAFAQIAQEVGAKTMQAYAEKAGITSTLTFDGITTAAGQFDLTDASVGSLSWSAIGQYTDLINPCEYMTFMGMIANGGSAAQPYLMETVKQGDSVQYAAKTTMLESGIREETTQKIAKMMRDNVVNSYGTGIFPDVYVCAKSGSAETQEGKTTNAMFAGFVQDEQYPLAFIVVVEEGGYGSKTAAPIAGKVLQVCIDAMNAG
ncbi:MAG: penicillin-binding transpeptidase domain-containing protein [Oscillospiraceae bacterium]|nr:penicillin-binding transpeptidase domain-containing protein [Oscillospiraceae bacterium]